VKPDAHPDPRNGKVKAFASQVSNHMYPSLQGARACVADYHATEQAHSRGGHFISQDPAGFDAPFFGLTAKEVASSEFLSSLLLSSLTESS
jgi:hypothetical protein